MSLGARRLLRAGLPAVGLALVVASMGGCERPSDQAPSSQPPRNVRAMTVREVPFAEYFEIAGPVQPVRGTDVSSEEAGTVTAIPHDKGARVATGDVLVELDRRLLEAEMEATRARLEQQEYELDKRGQLFAAQKISRLELLATEAAYEQAKASSRTAAIRHERAAIKAPFAGIVADRFVEPGQLVAPGQPVARVIDPYTLKMVGTLTEREIPWLRRGQAAEILLDGMDHPASGKVGWVGFEADRASGKFKLEIHIDNPELELRSGVVGRARILKQDYGRLLAIPRDCLVDRGRRPAVFLVQADTAALRPITLGVDQGLMVVVTSGLAVGDRVVVRGQRDLVAGARVVVTEEVDNADGSQASDPDIIKAAESRLRSWRDEEAGE
jgi:RND family efflux transporter MFP subunit